jgi:hypothetical protein
MSEDPKLFDAGDYNLFRYCHNDPIDSVDPMGLDDTAPTYSPRETSLKQAEDRAYNKAMADAQWRGSNLMHGAAGAIGIGTAGYQTWMTQKLSLALMSPADRGRMFLSKFPVKGGTYEEREEAREDIKDVLATSRGEDYATEVNRRGYGVTTHLTKEHDAYADDAPSAHVRIDPTYHPKILTTAGLIPATTRRVIAHEFGHAIMGTRDDGPGRMNNVRLNENPIMRELGEPERLAY